MPDSEDRNSFLYLLAGFGLGAIVGAAAGLLFAPRPGTEIRHELGGRLKDLRHKTEEWIAEQRAKRSSRTAMEADAEEVGA